MIVSCARLPGNAVVDRFGGDLGRVERLMIEVRTGRIAYVVLAHGGVLGIGERQCAVQWEHLRFDPGRRCFVLDRACLEIGDHPLAERVGLS